jgi:signal transduction histidine kinase
MRPKRRPSLASAPFRASLLVLLALALFIAIFWVINQYQTYRQSISNIERNYKELYQERVHEELGNVLEFIDQRRSQAILRVEDELRVKVQSAYTIASHIYQMHKDNLSITELRSMATETLRPIRWSNGRGYYFAGRIKESTIDLFADDPLLEASNPMEVRNQRYQTIFQNLEQILQEKGAGIYRHNDLQADGRAPHFPGISFVKYFKPFDWYIGAGTSNEIIKATLQEEILAAVQNMRFSKNGHILCFDSDGTILSHPNTVLIGRSISDMSNEQGKTYGEKMLKAGLQSASGEYLLHTSRDPNSGHEQQRLSFIKPYPDWNWIVIIDISMDAMEKAIQNETHSYTSTSIKNAFIFLGLLSIAVIFLLCMAYYHSVRTKNGINLFTDFFRKAAHTQVKIRNTDSTFAEFEYLAELANAMVDDIVQKEQLLGRDELRLDTLLQLGEMDEYSIRDKYDFVLHRIIQVTGSDQGYIALVNHAHTHCTVCSQINLNTGEIGPVPDEGDIPHLLVDSGLTGNCVLETKRSIINTFDESSHYASFPYEQKTQRRIDIPLSDNNTIVLVAGVCNSSRKYDNSDVRQITMLLEGMWLHIQKMCSGKEMEKLERQIIAISEEERSNIGRDLHDDLGSHLSGVELLSKVLQQKLEKAAPEQAEQLSTIRNLIRDAIDKTRRLSRGLYPVHIIEHGLEAAIEELLTEIKERYGVPCSLSFDGHVEPLASNITPHIYYIVREAIFNAAKHAKPNMIEIIVQRSDRSLLVTIADDGQGMTEQRKKKGLGLHTMHYRAKAIGATLDISPRETGGTIVTLQGEITDELKNSHCR